MIFAFTGFESDFEILVLSVYALAQLMNVKEQYEGELSAIARYVASSRAPQEHNVEIDPENFDVYRVLFD